MRDKTKVERCRICNLYIPQDGSEFCKECGSQAARELAEDHFDMLRVQLLGSDQLLKLAQLCRAELAHREYPSKDYRSAVMTTARAAYVEEGSCEIDDDAQLSVSEEGCYVGAWVWVGVVECPKCNGPVELSELPRGPVLCPSCLDKDAEPATVMVRIFDGVIDSASVKNLPGRLRVTVIDEDTQGINDKRITETEFRFRDGEEVDNA